MMFFFIDLFVMICVVVFIVYGELFILQDFFLFVEIELGVVFVCIVCMMLCGMDIEIWEGKMLFFGMLFMVFGYEMVGEVVVIGFDICDVFGCLFFFGDCIGWLEFICGECYGCVVLCELVVCFCCGYGFFQCVDVLLFVMVGFFEYVYVILGVVKFLLLMVVKDIWVLMVGCVVKIVL